MGLAVLTASTTGAVAAGEFARRLRGRAATEEPSEDGPIEALQLAGLASRDTVKVAVEGYSTASRAETALFNLLSGFAGSFAFARISTRGIRAGWWPLGNVTLGGRHIHHFVPGIGLAFASGAAALILPESQRHPALAVPFGVGVGLTLDEAALLLDLRDVYWTREGVLSVQVSLAGLALVSGTLLALRMLRRGEEAVIEAGLVPDEGGVFLAPSPVAQASA